MDAMTNETIVIGTKQIALADIAYLRQQVSDLARLVRVRRDYTTTSFRDEVTDLLNEIDGTSAALRERLTPDEEW